MNKITSYMLIAAISPAELASQVNSQLEHGWQPFGAPSYSNPQYLQALVKYE